MAFLYLIHAVSFIFPLYDALDRWQTVKPQNYSVVVNYGTYASVYRSSREIVKNGVVAGNTGTQPTIDRLFDQIKACIFNPLGFLTCEVAYHPVYGYPTRFAEADLDLGSTIEISEFRPER